MFIFIIVFSLKRAKEKRLGQQEEHEKIKDYGESITKKQGIRINEKTFSDRGSGFIRY